MAIERDGEKPDEQEEEKAVQDEKARRFRRSFRAQIDRMRVRGFVHFKENVEPGPPAPAYYSVEAIAARPSLREVVIADVTKRVESLSSELRMWNITPAERDEILRQMNVAMGPVPTEGVR